MMIRVLWDLREKDTWTVILVEDVLILLILIGVCKSNIKNTKNKQIQVRLQLELWMQFKQQDRYALLVAGATVFGY